MFNPALADVAVVVRDDARWRLVVRRFTGDVLATTPLHVDGPFQPRVLDLVTRILDRWNVAASTEWDGFHGTWSVPLVVRGSERLRTPTV